MSEASHNIQVRVDVSQGLSGLAALRQAAQSTSRELRSLGGGGKGFDALAKQVQDTSGAFNQLARSLTTASAAARSIAAMSASGSGLGSLSRGAHDARNAVQGLTSALNPFSAAMKGIAVVAGGLSLSHFSKSILETGNAVTSFKLALDSIATGPREAGDMFDYVAATSNKMGVSLESNLETFKNLRVSMASLGIDTNRTKDLFENLTRAFTALHTTPANVKRAMYDISEVFSLGKLDAMRVRAISTHIPGFVGALQEALKGKELHAAFREGIPPETVEAVAKILGQQYSKAQEQALNHAQANLAIMGNKFTEFRAQVFDNGFDSGLSSFLKEMNSALDGAGFKNFGATVGEGFRQAFAGATMLGKAIIDLRAPLAEVLKTLGTFALAVSGVSLLAGAFTLLTSPLGALAALATLVATQWDNLAATFRRAALGAVESYTLISGLVSGKGWDASKQLAANAGAEYLQKQAGAKAGEGYAESFLERVKSLFASVPGLNLDKFNAEWNRLMKESAPSEFKGASDYANTANRQDEILLRQAEHAAELSNKLKTLREQLTPTTAAFDKLREVLEKVESMRGKKIGGHAIADSELNRMAAAAKENAFRESSPAASRIRDLSDSVRIDSEALAASGGNKDLMREEKQFLQERLALKRKGVDLTNEEASALKALIHTQSELNKRDGLSAWAESQKTGMDAVNSSIGHGLDTVADGLAKIATEGKNIKETFRDMLRSIAADLIRNGIRSMMAEGIRGLNLPSMFGGAGDSVKAALGLGDSVVSKAQSAVDDAAKSLASTVTPHMDVQAAVVNINGGIGGASGLDAFKPGSSIQDAIRPQAVSGIAPSNATAPLFSNDNALGALQEFKSNVRTGGLGNIPNNSATLFGAGLNPTQALGALPGFKEALKSSSDSITKNSAALFGAGLNPTQALGALPGFKDALKANADGITRNSVADFGKVINLQKIASVADRAGLTNIGGGSGNLATLAGREQYAWSFFKSKGYSDQDAAKILGNIKQESSFNPLSRNPNDAGPGKDSWGIAQWNRGRFDSLKAYAAQQGKPWQDYQTQLGFMHQEIQTTPYYRNALRNSRDAGAFGHAYEGFGDSSAGTRAAYGNQYLRRFGGKQSAGVDFTPTGSIGNKISDQSKRAQQAMEQQANAAKRVAEESQKASQLTQQMSQPLQSFDGGVSKLSESMSQGIPATESFSSEISKLLEKMLSGLGGGGGGIGDAVSGVLGGLFSEGGSVDNPSSTAVMPASYWAGAPHFANGGAVGDGIPIIAHPGEIVLNRAQQANVASAIGGGDDNRQTSNVVNVHIASRDADSFRRSKGQIGEAMARELGRARTRNG